MESNILSKPKINIRKPKYSKCNINLIAVGKDACKRVFTIANKLRFIEQFIFINDELEDVYYHALRIKIDLNEEENCPKNEDIFKYLNNSNVNFIIGCIDNERILEVINKAIHINSLNNAINIGYLYTISSSIKSNANIIKRIVNNSINTCLTQETPLSINEKIIEIVMGISLSLKNSGPFNVDYSDFKSIFDRNSELRVGVGSASDYNRASTATLRAIKVIHKKTNDLRFARKVLITIQSDYNFLLDELNIIVNTINPFISRDATLHIATIFESSVNRNLKIVITAM